MTARIALARGIVRLRKARGWTQADLAEAADMSVRFLSSIEQGARVPSLETVEAICSALAVSASELFAAGEELRPTKRAPGSEVSRIATELATRHEKDVTAILHSVSRMLAREASPQRERQTRGRKRG